MYIALVSALLGFALGFVVARWLFTRKSKTEVLHQEPLHQEPDIEAPLTLYTYSGSTKPGFKMLHSQSDGPRLNPRTLHPTPTLPLTIHGVQSASNL
jgi:hypothetical protein